MSQEYRKKKGDVYMGIWVNKELKNTFRKACVVNDSSMAHEIKKFMEQYITENEKSE